VEIGELHDCFGDRALLEQVLVNLLSNAFKFTARCAAARVEVGALRQGEETVYYVRDNGVGFDMRYAERLFGVFQRLHAQEDFEGTGIGLSIVHRIVTRHGGRVWAESRLGEGTTLYFTLPAEEERCAP
jgi:light-regulated signal transduction histidine kinase (bacteriophytochrome)